MKKLIPLLFGLVALGAHAADTKISGYPAASALGGTEVMVGVQGGATKKITALQVSTYAGAVTQSLTNKTIDGDLNTIQDVGFSSLNAAMVPTWTGNPWRWNGAEIRHLFGETGLAADTGLWEENFNGGVYTLRTRTDADGAGLNILSASRVGTALDTITFGDAINPNPITYVFRGGGGPALLVVSGSILTDVLTTSDLVANGESTFGAGGIYSNGGGLKHSRVTTGSVGAGVTALVTITWGTAFADANYTATCSVLEATTSALSMSVQHMETQSASALAVRVLNNAVGSLTGTLNCIAIHD